ncbi:MAG: hypothetical protein EA343_01060 [Nodularia sp. (in: Bacteria)]|nr:MAG: hypothetical protein EA343_01060 [Nodularia sp. (in: cyanobacteria)]
MLKRTQYSRAVTQINWILCQICTQHDKITFMYAIPANVGNLPDKIQEISMSAKQVYRKQLYLQGVRG